MKKTQSYKDRLKGNNKFPMDDRPHLPGLPEIAIITMAGNLHPEIYVSDRVARLLSNALKTNKILIITGNHDEGDSRNIFWEREEHELKWMGSIAEADNNGSSSLYALKALMLNNDSDIVTERRSRPYEEDEILF